MICALPVFNPFGKPKGASASNELSARTQGNNNNQSRPI